jgi:UDP-N-acetylmuramate dehydrogenase
LIVEKNISLKPYNTFAIDANAKLFCRIKTLEGLKEVLADKTLAKEDKLILGGGSNILLTRNYNGLVIKNEISGIEVIREDADHYYVRAGAGVNWHQLVMYCVNHNYAGIENLSLIPGNTGASPMQNIGAYGVEIKDVFHELEALHIDSRQIKTFSLDECRFGYRESVFKNIYRGQFIISSVTFRLNKKPVFNTSYGAISQELESMGVKELSIRNISQAVINIRSSKLPDPARVGNAGSFFKNPIVPSELFNQIKKQYPAISAFPLETGAVKLAAGWLIEQCGWKGYRKGDAGCYPKQALVLVNYGNAKGEEIFALSSQIIDSVMEKFGVQLEREVNII